MLLVAAVGNDGPAAAPLYPAAYPEVVGVTGVDARGDVLPEAAAGRRSPSPRRAPRWRAGARGRRYTVARGTSFAAPLVAGLLARAAASSRTSPAAALAIAALSRQAIDAGAPGRDVVFGHGVVGRELRTDPARAC